jgi:signal transduction histidine kinase
VAVAWLTVVEAVLLIAVFSTIYNVWFASTYVECSASFAVLPSIHDDCVYSGAEKAWYLLAVIVLLGLIAWSWWLVAGWMLRPLAATAHTVRRLGPHNLGQRIRLVSGPDPYKELADAIDDTLDRLAAGYESQRRFAANASHELRTPLAVQRLLTEVAMEAPDAGQDLQRLGVQLLRTNEQSENLIEGLLVLAESDRGLQGKVPARLDELAAGVIETHRELAARHQVTLRPKLSETTVPCDPVLIERLIANLVSNAVKDNEPGGWVEVEVTADPVIVVSNSGEQVPAEAVPMLFEPFKRLGADRVRAAGRGGVGLGLAIVRSIVLAHQGTIRARPQPAGGLKIEIALPAHASAGAPAGQPWLVADRSGQKSRGRSKSVSKEGSRTLSPGLTAPSAVVVGDREVGLEIGHGVRIGQETAAADSETTAPASQPLWTPSPPYRPWTPPATPQRAKLAFVGWAGPGSTAPAKPGRRALGYNRGCEAAVVDAAAEEAAEAVSRRGLGRPGPR